MALTPSPVVVSDRESLEQNFVENGLNVFCQAAFGAGAYAIGSTLLGAAPLAVPAALLTTGALLTAMTICPSRPTQEGIFGSPSGVSGGQCPGVAYVLEGSYEYYSDSSGSRRQTPTDGSVFLGPVSITNRMRKGLQSSVDATAALRFVDASGTERVFGDGWGLVEGSLNVTLRRRDGLPDTCGNAPNSGSQVITNVREGDTIDNSKVVNNSNFQYVIPVTFAIGGVVGTINMPFSHAVIDSLFPLNFSLDVGGVRFGFGEDPDGKVRLKPVHPDPKSPKSQEDLLRKMSEKIAEIKECVCKPDVDLDMLFLPYTDVDNECSEEVETFLVPKGSVGNSTVNRFVKTAAAAAQVCKEKSPEQKPKTMLYSATSKTDGKEIFTPELSEEIVSLTVVITGVNNSSLEKISLYPGANQRKFGSVAYSLSDDPGGGDYLYVFDDRTFVPLPRRGKKGKLRILFKAGISFEVWDTGERF